MAYNTQTDLENALGVQTVKAIFDDDLDGLADAAPIAACLAYGDAEANSFLAGVYDVELPFSSAPTAIKYAALDFCCAYAMRRRPDIVKAMGESPWTTFADAAVEKMRRFVKAEQRIPAASGTPENVGGEVRTGDADNPTMPTPARTFQNMGDF